MGKRKTVSEDLKRAMVRMRSELSVVKIAKFCDVSDQTVYNVLKIFRATGDVTPAPSGAPIGRPRRLDESEREYLKGLIDFRTDVYLDELAHAILLGTNKVVHPSTVLRTLESMDITTKNLTRHAMEQDPYKVAQYELEISEYDPTQLIFLDESYCDKRNTSRLTGWSEKGTRAMNHTPFLRGRRYSILPALSLDGVLDVEVMEGAVNGDIFCEFVNNLTMEMNPYPGKNSVLVMDNVRFHLREEVRETLEAKGMRIVYLPPYSPELNPIEPAFGCTKAWIRRHNMEVREAMCDQNPDTGLRMIEKAVWESITPEKAAGWFRDCGYF